MANLLVPFVTPVGGRKVFCLLVLRTCDILVGIRIRGSVPLNYGSGFGSGSVYFILLCMVEGRGGKEQCSFRTRTGAKSILCMVEGRGGKEQCSVLFAHVPEPNFVWWWKDGVEKNGVLFAHVPEPNLRAYSRKTGRKRWFFFAHVPEPDKIYMIDTHQILVDQQWSDKVVKNQVLIYTVVPSNKRFLIIVVFVLFGTKQL
jgi:hypothetical protein